MTACPWKLNHGDHHVSCFYHCHTHTRFPQRRSNPRYDIPRLGHGSSDVAITALPCISFADRWEPRLWVPHVSDRMVGLFASGDPHPPDVPLIPLGPTAPLPFVCMTCGPAELRRPSTFYHRHTRLDAVCLLRCCAPIRTPAPLNFHPAAVTHFVPGINPQLEYFCTTGSTRRCGHLRLVTPRRPAVAPSPRPRHHRPVHLERVSREPHHHHENDMWASRI